MSIASGGVAAAKAAMRAAIRKEIQKLKAKMREAKEVKQKIKRIRSLIDQDISTWNRSLGAFE